MLFSNRYRSNITEDVEYSNGCEENESYKEAFEILDINEDGLICKDDVKTLLGMIDLYIYEDYNDALIEKMIGEFNQDGGRKYITFADFKRKLKPKISSPYNMTELSTMFHQIREITEGIPMVDRESNAKGA